MGSAKKAGIPVSFDLASYGIVRECRDGIRKYLQDYVDIVFANELEAAEFAGTNDPESDYTAGWFRHTGVSGDKSCSEVLYALAGYRRNPETRIDDYD